ncbi:MAG: 2-C-methyl-D-erythritol 4-phosphate cytidylyltransferase [Dehalococcoidia bacterium]
MAENNHAQPNADAVVVAAGRSARMGDVDKLWAPLTGQDNVTRPLLAYTLRAFQGCPRIERIALVVAEDTLERARSLVRDERADKVCAVVPGGARRQDSVGAGLDALVGCAWVAVHDGARPLVTNELIERGIDAAQETGASCCALPVPDTVKESDGGRIVRTLDRARLWLAQTPQVFRYDLLLEAHRRAQGDATDDAALVEALGVPVQLYEGARRNLKVTMPEDLALAQALLRAT